MTEFEIIELPADRASDKLPIDVETTGLFAWPNRRLRFSFDYSSIEDRWYWEVRLVGEGIIIPHQPVHYIFPYEFRDYLMFMFVDTTRQADKVTADNLGDPVQLVAFPGPQSENYQAWLDRQQQDETDVLSTSTSPDTPADSEETMIY